MIPTIEIKVRGYHIDVFGHVNNGRYLEFLEEARWAAFENRVDLYEMSRQGLAFTVVHVNINFRHPAVMKDTLVITSQVTKWGRRSAIFHQVVTLKGTDTVVADADVTFVIYDQTKRKTAILEGNLLARLQVI
jgi:thioesterase III